MKLVSIILPAHNAEKHIVDCLNSITQQTYLNWELIIINDGSLDQTAKIIESFLSKDTRITCVTNDNNMGLVYCLNLGIKLSKGKYVARMDSDDIMMPDRLELQVNFMETNPQVGVLGGSAILIDEAGNDIGKRVFPYSDKSIKQNLDRINPLLHPTIIFRKTIFEICYYRDKYPRAEDYDLWFRLKSYTEFANLQEFIIKYRIHPGQVSLEYLKKMTRDTVFLKIEHFSNEGALFYKFKFIIRPLIKAILPIWLIKRLV